MRHDGPHRSRGGAVHVRPERKMGRLEVPLTWLVSKEQVRGGSGRRGTLIKMLKKHANKKRRQRDRELED